MCSRHFISAYIPVSDALDDYREVIGRAKQEPEPSTGARIAPGNPVAFPPSLAVMCEKGAAYGFIQNDGERASQDDGKLGTK